MELLQGIIAVVREAGEIMLNADHIEETVEEKSGRANYVTAYDKKVQTFLFDRLAGVFPDAAFIGEEKEENPPVSEGYVFIIDPIDGTTNFMKGYCASCISVGLLKDGQPYMGVVYNPYLDEMFSAEKGRGAFRNESKIHVSDHELKEGIVLFGTAPYNEELSKRSFSLAYEFFERSLDVRRSGSAAIDLCNVACGRAELYFDLLLSPWDYAAGALILTEAGGKIMTADGKELTYEKKCGVGAGNEKALQVWTEVASDIR